MICYNRIISAYNVIFKLIILVLSMKKLGLATALLLAMTGAQAYQFQVEGQSEQIETENAHNKFTGAVQGTYYLSNVDSKKGPLAEAAFMNQASNVALAYNYGKYSSSVSDVKFNSQTFGAKAEAYVPTSLVPVYASAAYNHTYQDNKNGVNDNNGDRYAVEVGAMIAPNFLIAAGYTRVADKAQATYDAFDILEDGVAKAGFDRATIGDKKDVATARAKYVGAIDGTNMALGFEAGLIYGENTAYTLKSDLYFTPKLSVGASYAETSADMPNDNQTIWSANVNYFVTDDLSVTAKYTSTNALGSNPDTQTVGLNAKYRF